MIQFQLESWLKKAKLTTASKLPESTPDTTGKVYLLGQKSHDKAAKIITTEALSWQKDALLAEKKNTIFLNGKEGPLWILKLGDLSDKGHHGLFNESSYSQARDLVGSQFSSFKSSQVSVLEFIFEGTSLDQELGALVALDLSVYSYKDLFAKNKTQFPALFLTKKKGDLPVQEAIRLASATNTARHLVSLPPNFVNPQSFAKWVQSSFKSSKSVKVEIWNQQRLAKEEMNLLLAVGQGSVTPPCLVRISYQPPKKSKEAPIALVGKGITFDTGGLDIKPSSGMRLMKKDMGGAAAVVGVATWAVESKYPHPLEFYLALAENSVGSNSFRPSDVIKARNGLQVEIDNTDAEGRLVLADALDVAITQKQKPKAVINVATLTGAIKVGLGSEIAGLFCNNDQLAASLTGAGQESGDLNWRMPLYDRYWNSLSSPFADFKNSGESFGGAITAALFLQKFSGDVPWAHLDIYAWNDRSQGALQTAGGSGQPVQALIKYLLDQS